MDPMLDSRSLKSFAATAALGATIVIGVARRAEAQLGTGGTSGTTGTGQPYVAGDFFVAINGPDGSRLGPADVSRFFNLARCNCQTPVGIYVALLQSGIAKRGSASTDVGTVSFVLGPGCNTSVAQAGCFPIGTEPVQTFLNQTQVTIATDARTLSNPVGIAVPDGGAAGTCQSPNGGQFIQTINVNFDFDGDGVIDLSVPEKLIIDLAPPPAPTDLSIAAGGQALDVSWDPIDTSVTTDLLGFQILCSRADQYQVFKETATDGGATGTFQAAFVTCPSAQSGSGVEGMDPLFVCSPLLGTSVNLNTTTNTLSARIAVLQDGITYAAAVVAIDQSGNGTRSIVGFNTPTKTLSFYDTYRSGDPPGAATGGLCAVGPGRPRLKQTLGGLAAIGAGAVGLLAHRRRRGRRA